MILKPMKPAKLNMDKESHLQKLEKFYVDPSYVVEEKIDGCHYFLNGGRVLSTSISKKTGELVDKTGNFPHLVEGFMRANLGQAVLDGEIYYPDNKSYGVTEITGCLAEEAVRRQEKEFGWIHYMVFDILKDPEGNDLTCMPWFQRREILEQIGVGFQKECKYVQIIPAIRSRKKQFVDQLLSQGKEGAVFKFIHGIYIVGKRPMDNWVKLKVSGTDDVVIMGFEPPEKKYSGTDYENWPYWEDGEPVSKHYHFGWIGSITFGKYNSQGNLVYLGSCTGIDETTRRQFTEDPDTYIGQVMEIKFMEMTRDGRFRHPNFVRIHPDKNAEECVIEGEVTQVG